MKPRPILTAAILGASIIAAAFINAHSRRWQYFPRSEDYGTCMAFDTWTSHLTPCAK